MHHRNHRFTNMEEYKNGMKSRLRLDDNDFEVIYSEQNEDDRFEESHLPYLRKEDNEIGTLQLYLSHNIHNFIPAKEKSECTSIFGEKGLMKIVNDKPVFFCRTYPDKKATKICLNRSCKHVLFSMKSQKVHESECNRKLMTWNINEVLDEFLIDDFFDTNDYDFDEQIQKVKDLVEAKKTKMNEMLDVFEKIMISKVSLQAKEFKLRQLKEIINDKHQIFKGNLFANV